MSDPLDPSPAPDVSPLDLGDGRTVLFDEPTSGFYRVRLGGGEVQAFPARAEATRENALADLVTNPPPAPPVPVPSEVPAWRLKAVAKLAGLAPGIDAVLAALPEPARTVASAAWHEGNVIRRDSATVAALATALGLTPAVLDDLFRQADALAV